MRVDVITMRLNGDVVLESDSERRAPTSGELTIEPEHVGGPGAQVTVARLRTDGTTRAHELLPPLVEAKFTELEDDTFALTGVEVRGASRLAQAWYCKIDLWKPIVPGVEQILGRGLPSNSDLWLENGDAHVLLS
jgi:hypothetical protein